MCVSGAASECVCFFLCLRVSVRLCMSVYVGLSRRAQCDKELGGVGRREGISKPHISPSGISGDLCVCVCVWFFYANHCVGQHVSV